MHGMMMNRPLRIADIITLAEKIHPNEEDFIIKEWISRKNCGFSLLNFDLTEKFVKTS